MNLWIRLIRLWFTLIGRSRVELLSTTRVRLRVWPNDLDINGHVNNGRYLTLADLSLINWFARTGVLKLAREKQVFPVIGDALAKFRRDLKLFQSFVIETRMVGWNEKWGFFEHRFIRHGRVVGVVAIRGVFKTSSGSLDPQVLLKGLEITAPSPPLPQWAQQWNDSCESLSEMVRDEERIRGIRSQ